MRIDSVFRQISNSISANSVIKEFSIKMRAAQQSISSNSLVIRMTSIFKRNQVSLISNSMIKRISSSFKLSSYSISADSLVKGFKTSMKSIQESMNANPISTRMISVYKQITQKVSMHPPVQRATDSLRLMFQQIFLGNSATFRIDWDDSAGQTLNTVNFESDYSGTPTNYTMYLISGNSNSGTWEYSTADLTTGTFYWKSYALSNSGLANTTDTFSFEVKR
jgi:hypothetical protein